MLTASTSSGPLTTARVLDCVFGDAPVAAQRTEHPSSVHVILQRNEPRWIILGSPRSAMPVLRSWTPWKMSSRIQWNAVRFAAALNALRTIPGIESARAWIDPSYWVSKLGSLPENWSAVIHVGSPSHTRKAILFLIENGERVVCAGKIPLSSQSAEAILHEGAILDLLSRFDYLPRVLFLDRARGIVAQSWLDGRPVSRGFTRAHLNLISSLATSRDAVRVSDCLDHTRSEIEAIDIPFERTVLVRGVEFLDYQAPLASFVEHADFAPWNLKWIRNGVLGLVDWEWAVPHGLPWQDICRFFFLDDVHFRGPGDVWRKLNSNELLQEYRRAFEIPPEALGPLTMRYLLKELAMEWKAGNVWLAEYAYKQIKELVKTLGTAKG
jgi:hypothetical protein